MLSGQSLAFPRLLRIGYMAVAAEVWWLTQAFALWQMQFEAT